MVTPAKIHHTVGHDRLTKEHVANLHNCVIALGVIATRHNLYGIETAKRDVLSDIAKLIVASGVLKPDQCRLMAGSLQVLNSAFIHSIADHQCYLLSQGDDPLADADRTGLGSEVDDAFPSAMFDLSEARKCLVLGQPTACVLHLMRALEPALDVFQKTVGVPAPQINWASILEQIEKVIKQNGPKHVDYQWNREAAAQFLNFKDAWRNHAMHGRDTYNNERASSVHNSATSFLRHLASRLHE